jgi:hypothetical protein
VASREARPHDLLNLRSRTPNACCAEIETGSTRGVSRVTIFSHSTMTCGESRRTKTRAVCQGNCPIELVGKRTVSMYSGSTQASDWWHSQTGWSRPREKIRFYCSVTTGMLRGLVARTLGRVVVAIVLDALRMNPSSLPGP